MMGTECIRYYNSIEIINTNSQDIKIKSGKSSLNNYKNLINKGANYIELSSFIWDNPNLKPFEAIKVFK